MLNWIRIILKKLDKFFRDRPASAMILISICSQIIPYLSEYRLILSFSSGDKTFGPYDSIWNGYLFFAIFSSVISLAISNFLTVHNFKKIGIQDSDVNMYEGLTPSEMLDKVENNFSFLGTGANKLTSDNNFDKIINLDKCRILLCDPNSRGLKEIGDSSHSNYKLTVEKSIEKIKSIIDRGNNNIELRLYKANSKEEMPIFRIALYNDMCVTSFNYFTADKKDGSQLPQLHLKKFANKPLQSGFYYAYDTYFERLWKICEDSSYKYIAKD
ncbi:hypothetical protein RND59_14790 [Vibrio ruber]|uniref:hypothetical protein n=1 Tax=Vibrio ruber TaxID=184755 RepID=UPI0028938202|nr:hypothetical protein [Vibrio ruber]WNJ95374.1 hypothetical protein RND59_14790 [Vibrio ruber]